MSSSIKSYHKSEDEYQEDSDDESLKIKPVSTEKSKLYMFLKLYKKQLVIGGLIFVVLLLYFLTTPPKTLPKTPPRVDNENPYIPPAFVVPPEPVVEDSDKDYAQLSEICRNTVWRKDLYLNCTSENHNQFGIKIAIQYGATNLKAFLMSCIRFAIDAGMTMIIPKAPFRLEGDPGQFNQWINMNYLLDREYWIDSLKKECPQLNIINEGEEQNIKPKPKVVAMKSCKCWPPNNYKKGEYLTKVNETLKDNNITIDNLDSPVIINDNEAGFGWRFILEPNIRTYLRSIINYNETYINFGKFISDIIRKDYGQYIGFHLRIERGFLVVDYRTYVQAFIDAMAIDAPDIMTIYVAVGDVNIENQFREDMSKLNKTIVSKWDLAFRNQAILDELSTYLFDHRGVADQIILEKSDFFYGNGGSSLSYMIGENRGSGYISKCKCKLIVDITPAFTCCI